MRDEALDLGKAADLCENEKGLAGRDDNGVTYVATAKHHNHV